jgi:hypothetical protein
MVRQVGSMGSASSTSATQVHGPNISPNTPRYCSRCSPSHSASRSPLQTASFMRSVSDGARTRDLLLSHNPNEPNRDSALLSQKVDVCRDLVDHSRFVAYRGIPPDIVPIAATTAAKL